MLNAFLWGSPVQSRCVTQKWAFMDTSGCFVSVVREHTSEGLSEVKDGGEYLLHKSGCVWAVFVCLQFASRRYSIYKV